MEAADHSNRNWHPDFDAAWLTPGDNIGPVLLKAGQRPPDHVWGSVLLLGNFDGLHVGHRGLLSAARRQAALLNAPLGIMSCEPHPKQFFNPDGAPFRLSGASAKHLLCSRLGIDLLFMPQFGTEFAGLSATGFITEILVKQLGVRAVVVGQDFRFGRGRSGSIVDLQRAGDIADFETIVVADLVVEGERMSSSTIRGWVASGRLSDAQAAMGMDWLIEAKPDGDHILRFDAAALLPPPGAYSATLWNTHGALISSIDLDLRPDRTARYHGEVAITETCLVSDWLDRSGAP